MFRKLLLNHAMIDQIKLTTKIDKHFQISPRLQAATAIVPAQKAVGNGWNQEMDGLWTKEQKKEVKMLPTYLYCIVHPVVVMGYGVEMGTKQQTLHTIDATYPLGLETGRLVQSCSQL